MTDKEKIRAEIERRIEELQPCNTRENLRAHGAIAGYYQILSFINSMQEEPVSEDTMTIRKEWFEHCKESWYNEGYIDGKYNRDRQFKEPVSEDLEGAAKRYSDNEDPICTCEECLIKTFKAGAKWQKEQFEKDYTNLCNGIATAKGIAVAMAYDKGMADAREQMMKNIWKPADGDDLPEIDREVIALLDNGKVVFAHRPNPDGWDGKSLTSGKVEHYTPKTYDKGGWNIPNVKYWLDVELPKEIEL